MILRRACHGSERQRRSKPRDPWREAPRRSEPAPHQARSGRGRSFARRRTISGSSFNSTRGGSSFQTRDASRCSRCRRITPPMSSQSFSRFANALRTTRSSALQVTRSTSRAKRWRLARATTRSSKGNAPSDTSSGTPFSALRRTTRVARAKSRASARLASKRFRRAPIHCSSEPKPVKMVRSTSCVRRGSPQRCTATAPMIQNRQRLFWQNS